MPSPSPTRRGSKKAASPRGRGSHKRQTRLELLRNPASSYSHMSAGAPAVRRRQPQVLDRGIEHSEQTVQNQVIATYRLIDHLMMQGNSTALAARRRHSLQSRQNQPAQRRPARIVFVVMSAVAKAATVDQLARSLRPHPVLVHHDFSQQSPFELQTPQIRFVPDPVRTGWAQFGFVDAIFHSLEHALEQMDFDYLQLLSPTCLPIKPLADFERHINGTHEAHFDAIDLSRDTDARLSVGYRAFTTEGSLSHRIARRLVNIYYGDSAGRRDEAGVWLRTGRSNSAWAALAGWPLHALAGSAQTGRLAGQRLPLHYGSVWFGARRHIIEGMVRAYRQPGLRERFARMHIAEEFLIPSLLMHLRPRRAAMNHLIARFDGAHPGVWDSDQILSLGRSPAWFARKFPDDPQAPVRQLVIEQLVGEPSATLRSVA